MPISPLCMILPMADQFLMSNAASIPDFLPLKTYSSPFGRFKRIEPESSFSNILISSEALSGKPLLEVAE